MMRHVLPLRADVPVLRSGYVAFQLMAVGGLLLGSVAAALAVHVMGFWALAPPVYLFAILAAAIWPREAAVGLMVVSVALEPQSVDATKYLSRVVFDVPPGVHGILPITIAPIEIMLVMLTASLYLPGRTALRPRPAHRLPILVFAIPLVVLMGALYGMNNGAPANLAYIEARGILYGACAFLIALRIAPDRWDVLARWVMVAAGVLAVITIYRYVEFVRGGDLTVPIEFAFAHESPIFLSAGVVVAALLGMRNGRSASERLLLFGYGILILAALLATQRRAATAVLLVGVIWVGLSLVPRRPVMVLLLAVPLLIGGGLYTAAYWDKEYGAMAQPARAIRSQIDPTPRDESSDLYRNIERQNVMQTIRATPIFGVGLGRQFFLYEPLPDLTAFWPLQYYTPHQNVLWLWLKVGFLGLTAFLAVAALAVSRCLSTMRGRHCNDPEFIAAATLSAVVLMYLVYGTLDLAFTGTRPMAPLAAAVALCFMLRGTTAQSGRTSGNYDKRQGGSPVHSLPRFKGIRR